MNKPSGLRRLAARQWEHGGWLSDALLPLSALAGWFVRRRQRRHASGASPTEKVPVPVVVVGNLYVGGTGKTPVVIAVVQALRAAGLRPGVLSRGYGIRVGREPRTGQGDLDPARFGDEPALIAACTAVPLAVHPKRARAARELLARYPDVNVIVSDDGLQHLALGRDIEIVVQDERGLGNGRLLPAGPLREPPQRLASVDAIVTNIGHSSPTAETPGTDRPLCTRMTLRPTDAVQLTTGRMCPLAELAATHAGRPIAAVAGIGNPDRFFSGLRAAGVSLDLTIPLADHYDFAVSPFQGIAAELILITSKDAVKCRALTDARLWEVPVRAVFDQPAFLDRIVQQVRILQPPCH